MTEETKRRRPSVKRPTVLPPLLEEDIERSRAQLAELERENEQRASELSALQEARKKPQHSKSTDFRDAYVLDVDTLRSFEDQITRLVGEDALSWTAGFVGGHNVSATGLSELLDQPLLQTRQIDRLTASVHSYTPPSLVRLSLRIVDGSLVASSIDISARDLALVERVTTLVREGLQARSTWYGWFYRLPVEILIIAVTFNFALFAGLLLLPKGFSPGAFLFGIGAPTLAALGRRWLFRRVEFDIGYSGRKWRTRRAMRNILGPVVIIGTALSVGANLLSEYIFSAIGLR